MNATSGTAGVAADYQIVPGAAGLDTLQAEGLLQGHRIIRPANHRTTATATQDLRGDVELHFVNNSGGKHR